MEKPYKVMFHKKNCIGVVACEVVFPEAWKYEKDKGVVTLKSPDATKTNEKEELFITKEELSKFMESAEVCPVEVIEIYEVATNKKIFPNR